MDKERHEKADGIRSAIKKAENEISKFQELKQQKENGQQVLIRSITEIQIPETHAQFFIDQIYCLYSRELDRLKKEYEEL